MGLTVALNTAISGLIAHQQAIAATSENIANVNVPEFSRREADFFTDAIPNQFAGVSVELTRAGVDRFLRSAVYSSQSSASSLNAIAGVLEQIEATLGAPGDNNDFANALNEAYASFAELAAAPSSLAAKAVAVSKLEDAFSAFSRTISAIDDQSLSIDARLRAQADQANALLRDIYNLNQIAPESNGASDEIDARLRDLSALIDISVVYSEDGRVSVSLSNGQLLVNSASLSAIVISPGATTSAQLASADPATGAVGATGADVTALIGGGEIGGLLRLRNTDLPQLRESVVSAAGAVAADINAAYAQNVAVGQTAPSGDALIVQSNGVFTVNAAIAADPSLLAIARPAGGAPGGANDGAGAGAIASLGGAPSTQGAAEAVTLIGAAAKTASDRAGSAQRFAEEVEVRRLSEGGVNLDEELSNLLLFQRAYSANARVISAIDEMYQSLLNII
ncbi:MAG: flagellar hook-associated protein FlgK [Pseudomonadota bacterium]